MQSNSAKNIVLKPVDSRTAKRMVKLHHYSGKVVNNSQLHFGVFLNGKIEGVLSYGPPMDKNKVIGFVKDTKWTGMLELNRMAFSDTLPRNSESRALAISFKLIKKHYPHIEWILSYSDGTQSGDGTIYRAAGFWLTNIGKNKGIVKLPDGTIGCSVTYTKGKHILENNGKAAMPEGTEFLDGFQMRYLYPLNETIKQRLTVPIIPYSEIDKAGAGMYKGEKVSIQNRRAKHSADAV